MSGGGILFWAVTITYSSCNYSATIWQHNWGYSDGLCMKTITIAHVLLWVNRDLLEKRSKILFSAVARGGGILFWAVTITYSSCNYSATIWQHNWGYSDALCMKTINVTHVLLWVNWDLLEKRSKILCFAVSTTCNTKIDLETTTNESIHHSDILCMKSVEKSDVSLLLNA